MIYLLIVITLCFYGCSLNELEAETKNSQIKWQVAKRLDSERYSSHSYPSAFALFAVDWEEELVIADQAGCFVLSKLDHQTHQTNEFVQILRTDIYVEQKVGVRLYGAHLSRAGIFLNGKRQLAQALPENILELDKGLNEIFIAHTIAIQPIEICVEIDGVLGEIPNSGLSVEEVWQADGFNVPEAVVYDNHQNLLFVSNFGQFGQSNGSISILDINGKILDLSWVSGLDSPTGMFVDDGKLYVVERSHLAVYGTKSGNLIHRHLLPAGTFYNDVIKDNSGIVYVSNTTPDISAPDILRLTNDGFVTHAQSNELNRVNGLLEYNGGMIAGSTGTATVAYVSLNGKVNPIALLAGGIIDGIKILDSERWLASQWRGRIFVVDESGNIELLIPDVGDGMNAADFDYIPELKMIIVPTFFSNAVLAYKLPD